MATEKQTGQEATGTGPEERIREAGRLEPGRPEDGFVCWGLQGIPVVPGDVLEWYEGGRWQPVEFDRPEDAPGYYFFTEPGKRKRLAVPRAALLRWPLDEAVRLIRAYRAERLRARPKQRTM